MGNMTAEGAERLQQALTLIQLVEDWIARGYKITNANGRQLTTALDVIKTLVDERDVYVEREP